MLCFSGSNTLNIKASNFPTHQQKLQVTHWSSLFRKLPKAKTLNTYQLTVLLDLQDNPAGLFGFSLRDLWLASVGVRSSAFTSTACPPLKYPSLPLCTSTLTRSCTSKELFFFFSFPWLVGCSATLDIVFLFIACLVFMILYAILRLHLYGWIWKCTNPFSCYFTGRLMK